MGIGNPVDEEIGTDDPVDFGVADVDKDGGIIPLFAAGAISLRTSRSSPDPDGACTISELANEGRAVPISLPGLLLGDKGMADRGDGVPLPKESIPDEFVSL